MEMYMHLQASLCAKVCCKEISNYVLVNLSVLLLCYCYANL